MKTWSCTLKVTSSSGSGRNIIVAGELNLQEVNWIVALGTSENQTLVSSLVWYNALAYRVRTPTNKSNIY